MNKYIISALNLSADERIIFKLRPSFSKSSPSRRRNDILGLRYITTKKIVHLIYFARKQSAQVTDCISLQSIVSIALEMQQAPGTISHAFDRSVPLHPVLIFKTIDNSYIYALTTLIYSKRKVGQLVESIKCLNPDVTVTLNYKRDNPLFGDMDDIEKYRMLLLSFLSMIGLGLAIWRLISIGN